MREYEVTTLRTPEQHAQAAALYRDVFGYQDPSYGVSPRLLGSLVDNGGSVVGALDDTGRVVAFAFGFCGTDGTEVYHYSQAAVVIPELQGQGLGRRLKEEQRTVALKNGVTRMRWSYDPLNTRNAHFNLDVLGARGRWYKPDYFGSLLDRVIVDWDLSGANPMLEPVAELPVEGASLRTAFQAFLAQGLVATSCIRRPDGDAVYLFSRE